MGISFGWTSPFLPILLSDHSPLETGAITLHESALISSFIIVGGMIGIFLYSLLVDLIGRKWSILLFGPPQILSWLLIGFGKNVMALYVSRLLAGLAGGGIAIVLPVFITEIADDKYNIQI